MKALSKGASPTVITYHSLGLRVEGKSVILGH